MFLFFFDEPLGNAWNRWSLVGRRPISADGLRSSVEHLRHRPDWRRDWFSFLLQAPDGGLFSFLFFFFKFNSRTEDSSTRTLASVLMETFRPFRKRPTDRHKTESPVFTSGRRRPRRTQRHRPRCWLGRINCDQIT